MRLHITETESGWTAMVAGEVDADNADELQAGLVPAVPREGTVLQVDAGQLTYIDSSGISALLRARQHLTEAGASVRIVNPSPAVRRIMQISGLEEVFGLS